MTADGRVDRDPLPIRCARWPTAPVVELLAAAAAAGQRCRLYSHRLLGQGRWRVVARLASASFRRPPEQEILLHRFGEARVRRRLFWFVGLPPGRVEFQSRRSITLPCRRRPAKGSVEIVDLRRSTRAWRNFGSGPSRTSRRRAIAPIGWARSLNLAAAGRGSPVIEPRMAQTRRP